MPEDTRLIERWLPIAARASRHSRMNTDDALSRSN